jgi:hypothetical protein
MSNKHLLLRSEGEHHSYLIVVELSEDYLSLLKKNREVTRKLETDSNFSSLAFFNYDISVYEAEDLHEIFGDSESLVVDGEPEDRGVEQRVDFSEMVFGSRDTLHYRFGIKHVHEVHETRLCNLRSLLD